MPKQAEIDYPTLLEAQERLHAAHKPFSDEQRGRHLQQFGLVLDLLPEPPARVLDMGCGTGWTTEFLAKSGYDAVGLDISPEMIALGAGLPSRRDLELVVGDFERVGDLGRFDAVVFFDSLHHAEDERAALEAAFDALDHGGVVVLSEPGLGHHLSPDSVRAVERFGVTEKEMPSTHVIELALRIGFRSGRSMPDPAALVQVMIRPETPPTRGLKAFLRRLIAPVFLSAVGGRSTTFTSADSQFAALRTANRLAAGAPTDGGFTLLEK